MKRRLINSDIFVILITLGLVIFFINENYLVPKKYKKLFKSFDIVDGRFEYLSNYDVGISRKTRVIYKYDGTNRFIDLYYSAPCKQSWTKIERYYNELMSFKFPVAVSKIDTKYAVALIRPLDFKTINKEFPDSLNSMYLKYFNCTWWESFRTDD